MSGARRFLLDWRVRLSDQLLLLLIGIKAHDLLGRDAVLDNPVKGGDEAILGHLRELIQRADQADVRTLRRLDRAHAPVVGGVHVAHLDRRTLAGETTGAECRQDADGA